MAYMDPQGVRTPKNRLSGDIEVLADTGEWGWSICRFIWDGKTRMGIRWNGSFNSEENMGNPQSRGKPTWFILPEDVEKVVQKALDNGEILGVPAGESDVEED